MNSRNIFLTCALVCACTLGTTPVPAHAYAGGGGGTGIGGTVPRPHTHIECHTLTRRLPFGRTISYPRCRVVRDTSFNERLRDFMGRVIHGAHGRTGNDR